MATYNKEGRGGAGMDCNRSNSGNGVSDSSAAQTGLPYWPRRRADFP